jgi:adenylylsulfate reductase, subunit B
MPPVVDKSKCKKCGQCVDICSEDVFFDTPGGDFPVVTYPEACWYCNCCVNECPEGAVRLRIPLNMTLVHK